MIDNFELIDSLLHFSLDNFYIVEIIQRKKDNPLIERNMNMLRTWYIDNPDGLFKLKDRIMEMCTSYNARAYIRLNVRGYRKTALENLKLLAGYIEQGDYKACANAFASAAGRVHADPDKKWLIDIDEKETDLYGDIINLVMYICQNDPNWDRGVPIVATVPTKNGYHLITYPFNQQKFREKYPEIEIHKDNPTILYIP